MEIVWSEFSVGENNYPVRKMGPIEQLHVFRRVTPLLVPIHSAVKSRSLNGVNKVGLILESSKELSALSDDHLDYVLNKCLGTVEIKGPDGQFRPLMVKGTLMYQQIELPELLHIVWAVLLENFAPFFSGLLAGPSNDEADQSSQESA